MEYHLCYHSPDLLTTNLCKYQKYCKIFCPVLHPFCHYSNPVAENMVLGQHQWTRWSLCLHRVQSGGTVSNISRAMRWYRGSRIQERFVQDVLRMWNGKRHLTNTVSTCKETNSQCLQNCSHITLKGSLNFALFLLFELWVGQLWN